MQLSHNSGRLFDGIVPDRYGAVEALCIAENILWLDDNICIYNSCGKNTWSTTLKKGYESLNAFVIQSRQDMDYSDKLLIPGVVASVNNILASDYHNAISNAVSSGYYGFEKIDINRGHLTALVQNELRGIKNISDEVLKEQKSLTDLYISQLDGTERENLKKSKKKIRCRKGIFFVKSRINKMLCKGMVADSKWLQTVSTKLQMILSKDTIIVKALKDIW